VNIELENKLENNILVTDQPQGSDGILRKHKDKNKKQISYEDKMDVCQVLY